MWLFTVLNHLFNFVLPAVWMATLLLAAHRLMRKGAAQPGRWWRHWLCLFGSGVAVLLAGLIVFQRDGKMMTYVALVVVMGVVQAWLARRAEASRQTAGEAVIPPAPQE